MAEIFIKRPKVVKGAFIEYGEKADPLFVIFQYNPIQLSRSRQLSFSVPSTDSTEIKADKKEKDEKQQNLRAYHSTKDNLNEIREKQMIEIQEETINLEIRIDATEKLNQLDEIAMHYGIGPELATLELMVQPKNDRYYDVLNKDCESNVIKFTQDEKPPLILFCWGESRVLPVNIQSMTISETDFDNRLNPIRATVQVALTVIEGANPKYVYAQQIKSRLAMMYLNNNNVKEIKIPE